MSCIDQSHVVCSEQAPAVANRDALPRRQSPWQPSIVGCCRNRRWAALTLSLLLGRRVAARARGPGAQGPGATRDALKALVLPAVPYNSTIALLPKDWGTGLILELALSSLRLSGEGWEQLCAGITQGDLGPCRTRSLASLEPESPSHSVGSSSLPCSRVAYATSPTGNVPP